MLACLLAFLLNVTYVWSRLGSRTTWRLLLLFSTQAVHHHFCSQESLPDKWNLSSFRVHTDLKSLYHIQNWAHCQVSPNWSSYTEPAFNLFQTACGNFIPLHWNCFSFPSWSPPQYQRLSASPTSWSAWCIVTSAFSWITYLRGLQFTTLHLIGLYPIIHVIIYSVLNVHLTSLNFIKFAIVYHKPQYLDHCNCLLTSKFTYLFTVAESPMLLTPSCS